MPITFKDTIMKSTKWMLLIAGASALLSGAGCPRNSLFADKCPLSYRLEWQIVEEGVSVDQQIELLSQLSAAAKADADKLNDLVGNASAKANFNTEFELARTVQSEEFRKASVSQDVFDEFVKVRTSSCNLWDGIQNGLYGEDDEAIKEARRLFTNIQEKFSALEEKKKRS
ncbi:hypothetical protein GGR26_002854 [Lewinella marina]|uniref:hypothetical protein n=1 Tax=Neolewinella marina TaxID=438751 RepID=UPI001179AED2|nr:hypothetical protein [Neolewinella marina]NJB87077.1 hypothetical protein [Neolewinella marina]